MAITCQALITRCEDSSRKKIGRSGYTGAPIPKAIVIHKLNGTIEGYPDQLCSPLPRFLCPVNPITCAYPFTNNPKGVHFIVTETGYTQFAELSETTLGLDYIDGTWTGLTALMPITDVNGPFIHVVVDGNCADKLVTLLCCIATTLGVSLPIIAASDLQTDRPEIILNPQLQAQVDNCFVSGGFVNPPDIFDLEDRVTALEACCTANTSDIIVIEGQIVEINTELADHEERIVTLEAKVVDIYEKIAIIPTLQAQIVTLVNQVTDILNRCCPKKVDSQCFHYQLTAGDEMIITANQPVWLNLPTKIEDRSGGNCPDCCPAIVIPGPLWMANLECSDCNNCETWNITAIVRFRLAQWCAGKKASVYLVACGKKYLLAEETITTTGLQVVTLSGQFLLPCGCTDVHLLVANSDDKITTAHVVEFADIKGCCA